MLVHFEKCGIGEIKQIKKKSVSFYGFSLCKDVLKFFCFFFAFCVIGCCEKFQE